MDPLAGLKQEAAEAAVGEVHSGMAVGLGTGSTAIFATRRVGALLRSGELRDIVAFATSTVTRQEAETLGIPLLPDELPRDLDVTIDGADEVDPELNLIKGGGGAHLREKLVAQASRRELIVVDDTKLSPRLGTHHPVPLEVLELGWSAQARFVASLGGTARTRLAPDGRPVRTDQGNLILDADFGPIADAAPLAAALDDRAGILAHGLFLGLTSAVVVAGAAGVRWLTPPGTDGSATGTARSR
ncbi:MAG TPA: ribose-5-phosphate isomerase RpiA [Acidimicrobiia bacterium]|nr:ribose-5-phosphate isomerase RpiA [Acidimicrobiia bacterium]